MAAKTNILLVGDAGPDEGSLRAQIDSLRHPLKIVTTSAEAVAAIEADLPDLVIIDASAPDVDAYKLAPRIKSMTRGKAVPVAFACLEKDLRAKVDSRDMGADDCFTKPIDTEVLAAHIRMLLKNRTLELALRHQNREFTELNDRLIDAKKTMTRELELARRIQQGMLPETLPQLERFQFAAALRPSTEVSGDFYDIYRLDETHYGFYVADAIGHGVPAALLTIFVKKGIQTRDITPTGYRLLEPAEVLDRLNRDLISENLSDNPFVTLLYGILDVTNATVRYASAGHPPAMLISREGSVCPMMSDGALLGIFESDFTTGEVTLEPGSRIVLYSDGIELAVGPDGKRGLDALIEYLKVDGSVFQSREAFTTRIDEAFDALLDDDVLAGHQDDVTLLALRMLR